MTAFLFIGAFGVVAVLVYMARYSGRLRVSRTRVIDAPLAAVYDQIVDLRRWPAWSPWLEGDPDPAPRFSPAGDAVASSYRWTRDDADLGRVEHLRIRAPSRIEQRLRLWQPFPLRGVCSWQLVELDGRTRVTLSLRGRVGFAMRAFAATVQGALALDFRYALDRLAGLVEAAHAPRYALSYAGVEDVAAVRYAYRQHTGPLSGVGAATRAAVRELREALARQGVTPAETAMALYFQTNTKQRTTTCRFCVPLGDEEVAGVAVASLPAHRAFRATLRGSRTQLELAWYLTMQRLAAQGLQPDLRIAPFERHAGEPEPDADGRDLTELLIPVRQA